MILLICWFLYSLLALLVVARLESPSSSLLGELGG